MPPLDALASDRCPLLMPWPRVDAPLSPHAWASRRTPAPPNGYQDGRTADTNGTQSGTMEAATDSTAGFNFGPTCCRWKGAASLPIPKRQQELFEKIRKDTASEQKRGQRISIKSKIEVRIDSEIWSPI